jgi:uncharacterized protein (DUF983 family)
MPDSIPVRWQPDRTPAPLAWPVPPMGTALKRGFQGLCPACGKTHMFNGFLKVVAECKSCGAPLGMARADDAPPYFTIVVVGHIVVPLMLLFEKNDNLPIWAECAIWLPVTLGLTLALMRPIKGATVGLMLRLGMMKSTDD